MKMFMEKQAAQGQIRNPRLSRKLEGLRVSGHSQQASAGSSYRRSSVVSFRLVLNNPTLREITDGYETKLHHAPGHDLSDSFPLKN